MTAEEIHDNPTGWINKHIRSYVATDGATGQRYDGKDSLLITTRGRKSEVEPRRLMCGYGASARVLPMTSICTFRPRAPSG